MAENELRKILIFCYVERPEETKDFLRTLGYKEHYKKFYRTRPIVAFLRFALPENRRPTLERTAKILHLTRERIRQIEYHAARTLMHPVRRKQINKLLGEIINARTRLST